MFIFHTSVRHKWHPQANSAKGVALTALSLRTSNPEGKPGNLRVSAVRQLCWEGLT